MANNIQNTYLKTINYIINTNLENKLCPNKFLEDYDLQLWNQHIFDLDAKRDMQRVAERVVSPLWRLLHDPALRRLA